MICPGCGHINKPGRTLCSVCTAPLSKVRLLKDVSNRVLLNTSLKSNRIYFYVTLVIIGIFAYYVFNAFYALKDAFTEEETSSIAHQIMQRRAMIEQIDDF